MIKKETFSNFWKDPVWSKVIANTIWAFLVFIAIAIWGWISHISILEVLTIKIELYWFVIFIGSFLLYRVLKAFKRSKPKQQNTQLSKRELIEREAAKFNSLKIGNVLWRWETNFFGNKYKIDNLSGFCLKHEPPRRLLDDRIKQYCPFCDTVVVHDNEGIRIREEATMQYVYNLIESEVEKKLNRLSKEL